jgi:hypothetical protein
MTPFGDTKFHSGVSSKKTQKETSDRKEGEEAPVESQKKKKKKTFDSTAKKERSAATLCSSPLLPLHKSHRSSAFSLARSLVRSVFFVRGPPLLLRLAGTQPRPTTTWTPLSRPIGRIHYIVQSKTTG